MKTLLFVMALSLCARTGSAGDAARFECVPIEPPREQGSERFYRIELSPGAARLELAGLVGPYSDLTGGLPLRYASYSESASQAGASWGNGGEVTLGLVFLGSWWGGSLRAFGEETDLRCRLAAAPAARTGRSAHPSKM